MSLTPVQLLLASASPRRRELLDQIGVAYRVESHSIEESALAEESSTDFVQRLAREKAQDVAARHPGHVVLGADTVVVCDDRALGKPADADAAMQMLSLLSGRSHEVFSAVALCRDADCIQSLSTTRVSFRPISEAEMRAYWNSGEPADKAGAYGIQGLAALFVSAIQGSYSGVVGLPLYETAELLRQYSIPTALERICHE